MPPTIFWIKTYVSHLIRKLWHSYVSYHWALCWPFSVGAYSTGKTLTLYCSPLGQARAYFVSGPQAFSIWPSALSVCCGKSWNPAAQKPDTCEKFQLKLQCRWKQPLVHAELIRVQYQPLGKPGSHELILQATRLSLLYYLWTILHLESWRWQNSTSNEVNKLGQSVLGYFMWRHFN